MSKNTYDEQYDRWGDVPGSVHVIKQKKKKATKSTSAKKSAGKKK